MHLNAEHSDKEKLYRISMVNIGKIESELILLLLLYFITWIMDNGYIHYPTQSNKSLILKWPALF